MIVHNRDQNMGIVKCQQYGMHTLVNHQRTTVSQVCTAQNKLFVNNLEDKPILPQVASQVVYNHGHSASIDLFRKSLRPI